MRPSRPRRPAFRLIEVLVVIVVIIIVIGLLLPAGSKLHVASGRMRCVTNNKLIMLAVHTYASVYQNALPALTSEMAKPQYGDYNGGILLTILPFLDQQVLFNSGALSLPSCTWYAPIPPNTTFPFASSPPGKNGNPLCTHAMSVYQCEADSTIYQDFSANQSTPGTSTAPYFFPWAASSYSANYQVFGTENNMGALTSGNSCGPKYDIGNVPDGTSNTIFFGEQFAACGSSAGNLWAYPGIGNYSGSQYSSAVPGAHVPEGVGNSIVNTPGATNSHLWAPVFANDHPVYGFTVGGLDGSIAEYNAAEPAGPLVAPFAPGQFWDAPPQTGISRSQCDKSRLQSFHTACVMVAMGDGSVRLVSPSVAQATWYAVIMPADGNAPGADW